MGHDMKAGRMKIGLMACALGLSAAAGAQAASEVELKNMAARVVVIPENRSDVKLSVAYGKADLPKIMISDRGNTLVASGQINKRDLNCATGQSVRIRGKGSYALSDLPVVTIRVPMKARIESQGALFGRIGAAKSLEFALGGCGDWTIESVADKAELSIGGSGTLRTGDLGDADVAVGGSGDVYTGKVQKLSGAIGGSGSITVAEVAGPVDIAIGGSGDVRINGGYAPKMDISIAGAGNVRFGGEAGDVDLSVVGSGDITLRKVNGHVSKNVMGSGNIKIGQ